MRVLVADKLPSSALARLREAGCEVFPMPDKKGKELAAAVAETAADVLIVRSNKVDREILSAGSLGLVVRAGAGVDTIDVAAASELGIYVTNCPGKNSLAVAELAIGLLINLDRRITDASVETKAGRWNKAEYSKARGLAGRKLAVLGFGRIGQAVAERALALGMRVAAWDKELPRVDGVLAKVELVSDLLSAVTDADAVSVHLPATPVTRGICDRALFERMKAGGIFVNTARAEVVDEEALRWAMQERGIRAGIDVFQGEPAGGTGTCANALLALPGLVVTPHIGASTDQAQEAVADEAVRIVTTWKATGRAPHVVNVSRRSPASHMLVVRHRNRVGVLSTVFSALRDASLNVEETENIVFEGAQACIARIHVDGAPGDAALADLRTRCPDILALQLVEIGA